MRTVKDSEARTMSEFLETARVGEQLAQNAPGVLGGAVQGGDRLAAQ